MKPNNFFRILVVFIVACPLSCGQHGTGVQRSDNSLKTKTYASPEEEAKALALPVDEVRTFPKDIKTVRAAAVMLSAYVSVKDSLYSLDISMQDARKAGVDEDLYRVVLQDLQNTNEALKEMRQRGEHPDMPNVKELYKKYRDSLK